jgi:hypothetical protein
MSRVVQTTGHLSDGSVGGGTRSHLRNRMGGASSSRGVPGGSSSGAGIGFVCCGAIPRFRRQLRPSPQGGRGKPLRKGEGRSSEATAFILRPPRRGLRARRSNLLLEPGWASSVRVLAAGRPDRGLARLGLPGGLSGFRLRFQPGRGQLRNRTAKPEIRRTTACYMSRRPGLARVRA